MRSLETGPIAHQQRSPPPRAGRHLRAGRNYGAGGADPPSVTSYGSMDAARWATEKVSRCHPPRRSSCSGALSAAEKKGDDRPHVRTPPHAANGAACLP
mmetsp:Transcript_11655/g.17784  ORF Transcript_11655/g.17784 Transcript_11655/m.17784 type:complete len:99 (-) Transcript_11655:207-503(-)